MRMMAWLFVSCAAWGYGGCKKTRNIRGNTRGDSDTGCHAQDAASLRFQCRNGSHTNLSFSSAFTKIKSPILPQRAFNWNSFTIVLKLSLQRQQIWSNIGRLSWRIRSEVKGNLSAGLVRRVYSAAYIDRAVGRAPPAQSPPPLRPRRASQHSATAGQTTSQPDNKHHNTTD